MKTRFLLYIFITQILPLAFVLLILEKFSNTTIINIIKYLLYIAAFIKIVDYYKIKKRVESTFPNYYAIFLRRKYLDKFTNQENTHVPLYYQYKILLLKSKAPALGVNNIFLKGYVGFILIFISIFFHFNWVALGLFFVTSTLAKSFKLSQPPVALFLANTCVESAVLYTKLNINFSPDKITCLLDLPQNIPKIQEVLFKEFKPNRNIPSLKNAKALHKVAHFDKSILNDSLRTKDKKNWRKVVLTLYKISKLIIIDSRFDSPLVQIEMKHIHDMCLWEKTIFIQGSNCKAEVLENFIATNPSYDNFQFNMISIEDIAQLS